jgi:aspartyl-tRNA(Asn)/glutamyl-tRNA(Gln) amidotransferase subunit A
MRRAFRLSKGVRAVSVTCDHLRREAVQDWLWMTAADLGRGIARGEIDPEALCETYLAAIKAHADADRIYARSMPDRARAEAAAAARRARLGLRHGPLDGVPISWKDLFDTAGVGTEAGSRLLEGRVPDRDADVVRAGSHAGLVGLGKTHMSELAFSGLGLNPTVGTPPGLHDRGVVPGGSSSGAAASVSFGLAAAAVGSDTGGSVRIPAAWNDLVGLKTTAGRVSCGGVVPLVASFDTIGPLTRSVEDAALMLAALEGGQAPDLRGASLTGTRFLVLDTYTEDARFEPRTEFLAAVARIKDAGAIIEHGALPMVDEAMSLAGPLFTPEAYGTWRDTIEAAPEKMFDRILERFRSGQGFSGPDVWAAWNTLHRCRAEYLEATSQYDAILLPTAPILPPNVERLMSDQEYFVTENLLALRNTRIGNLMGLCGLTLPTGRPSCGIMALAAPMQEKRLLRLGAAMESALR